MYYHKVEQQRSFPTSGENFRHNPSNYREQHLDNLAYSTNNHYRYGGSNESQQQSFATSNNSNHYHAAENIQRSYHSNNPHQHENNNEIPTSYQARHYVANNPRYNENINGHMQDGSYRRSHDMKEYQEQRQYLHDDSQYEQPHTNQYFKLQEPIHQSLSKYSQDQSDENRVNVKSNGMNRSLQNSYINNERKNIQNHSHPHQSSYNPHVTTVSEPTRLHQLGKPQVLAKTSGDGGAVAVFGVVAQVEKSPVEEHSHLQPRDDTPEQKGQYGSPPRTHPLTPIMENPSSPPSRVLSANMHNLSNRNDVPNENRYSSQAFKFDGREYAYKPHFQADRDRYRDVYREEYTDSSGYGSTLTERSYDGPMKMQPPPKPDNTGFYQNQRSVNDFPLQSQQYTQHQQNSLTYEQHINFSQPSQSHLPNQELNSNEVSLRRNYRDALSPEHHSSHEYGVNRYPQPHAIEPALNQSQTKRVQHVKKVFEKPGSSLPFPPASSSYGANQYNARPVPSRPKPGRNEYPSEQAQQHTHNLPPPSGSSYNQQREYPSQHSSMVFKQQDDGLKQFSPEMRPPDNFVQPRSPLQNSKAFGIRVHENDSSKQLLPQYEPPPQHSQSMNNLDNLHPQQQDNSSFEIRSRNSYANSSVDTDMVVGVRFEKRNPSHKVQDRNQFSINMQPETPYHLHQIPNKSHKMFDDQFEQHNRVDWNTSSYAENPRLPCQDESSWSSYKNEMEPSGRQPVPVNPSTHAYRTQQYEVDRRPPHAPNDYGDKTQQYEVDRRPPHAPNDYGDKTQQYEVDRRPPHAPNNYGDKTQQYEVDRRPPHAPNDYGDKTQQYEVDRRPLRAPNDRREKTPHYNEPQPTRYTEDKFNRNNEQYQSRQHPPALREEPQQTRALHHQTPQTFEQPHSNQTQFHEPRPHNTNDDDDYVPDVVRKSYGIYSQSKNSNKPPTHDSEEWPEPPVEIQRSSKMRSSQRQVYETNPTSQSEISRSIPNQVKESNVYREPIQRQDPTGKADHQFHQVPSHPYDPTDDDSSDEVNVDAPTPPITARKELWSGQLPTGRQYDYRNDSEGPSQYRPNPAGQKHYQDSRQPGDGLNDDNQQGQLQSSQRQLSSTYHSSAPKKPSRSSLKQHQSDTVDHLQQQDTTYRGNVEEKPATSLNHNPSKERARLVKAGKIARKPPSRTSSSNLLPEVQDRTSNSDYEINVTSSDLARLQKSQPIKVQQQMDSKKEKEKRVDNHQSPRHQATLNEATQTDLPSKPSKDTSSEVKKKSKLTYKIPPDDPVKKHSDLPLPDIREPDTEEKGMPPTYTGTGNTSNPQSSLTPDLLNQFTSARENALRTAAKKQNRALHTVQASVRMRKSDQSHSSKDSKRNENREIYNQSKPKHTSWDLKESSSKYEERARRRDDGYDRNDRGRESGRSKGRSPERRARSRDRNGSPERSRDRDLDRDQKTRKSHREVSSNRPVSPYRGSRNEAPYRSHRNNEPSSHHHHRSDEPEWVEQYRKKRAANQHSPKRRDWVDDSRRRQKKEFDFEQYQRDVKQATTYNSDFEQPPRQQLIPSKLLSKGHAPPSQRPPQGNSDWMKNLKERNKRANRDR